MVENQWWFSAFIQSMPEKVRQIASVGIPRMAQKRIEKVCLAAPS